MTVPTFRRPQQVLETMVIKAEHPAPLRDHRHGGTRPNSAKAQADNARRKRRPAWSSLPHRGNCQALQRADAVQHFPNFKHLLVIGDDGGRPELAGTDVRHGRQLGIGAWSAGLLLPCSRAGNMQAGRSIRSSRRITTGPPCQWVLYLVRQSAGLAQGADGNATQYYFDLKFSFAGGDSDLPRPHRAEGLQAGLAPGGHRQRGGAGAARLEADWIRARSLPQRKGDRRWSKRKRAGAPFGNAMRVVAKSL